MPINLNFKIRKESKVVRIDTLRNIDSESVAWWYCGIYKNKVNDYQPHALVGFRKLLGNCVSDDGSFHYVPLTALGQVRVGTIWKHGVLESSYDFQTCDFDIDYRNGEWRFTSPYDAIRNEEAQPFPQIIYPLIYNKDKNWLLEFKLSSGGKLIIPCIEFYSRCYGRSQELNRILATFPWMGSPEAERSKLYAPLDEPEEPNKWKVKLRKRLVNGDTTFLAHAKYDPYTEKAAKSIYAQIESSYSTDSKSPIFLKIPPWFQGPAEIRTKGIWFDNKRSFLALQVMGCSDPDGILIIREKENTSKREGLDPQAEGEAWAGVTETALVRPPDIIDLTGDSEPDRGTSNANIHDQDFVVMGVPRTIVDRHGMRITNGSGLRLKGNVASCYSSGETHGSGKGIGYVSIHAKPVFESYGALTDMWNAVRYIQSQHTDSIKPVEWFTFEDGYKSTELPNLIALEAIKEYDEPSIPIDTRHWPYYDVATKTARGVLVIRMVIHNKPVHIIEIQRRPRTKRDKNKQRHDAEEHFQGLVITFRDESRSIEQLKRLMSDVRYVKGIVKKLTHTIEFTNAFSHIRSEHDKIPFETVVLKALGKFEIKL